VGKWCESVHPVYVEGCRSCRLARHDRRYRRAWGLSGWGDWAAGLFGVLGGDRLARLYERWTGRPCGCNERRDAMNRWPTPRQLWRRAVSYLKGARDG
jgi:hypothetical protein